MKCLFRDTPKIVAKGGARTRADSLVGRHERLAGEIRSLGTEKVQAQIAQPWQR